METLRWNTKPTYQLHLRVDFKLQYLSSNALLSPKVRSEGEEMLDTREVERESPSPGITRQMKWAL